MNSIHYCHFRVPDALIGDLPESGKPPDGLVIRYYRGDGFEGAWEGVAPSSRGGGTMCKLVVNNTIFLGWAVCSMSDNFDYSIGRKIALGRAREKARRYYERI